MQSNQRIVFLYYSVWQFLLAKLYCAFYKVSPSKNVLQRTKVREELIYCDYSGTFLLIMVVATLLSSLFHLYPIALSACVLMYVSTPSSRSGGCNPQVRQDGISADSVDPDTSLRPLGPAQTHSVRDYRYDIHPLAVSVNNGDTFILRRLLFPCSPTFSFCLFSVPVDQCTSLTHTHTHTHTLSHEVILSKVRWL